jgi:hypothetical protein
MSADELTEEAVYACTGNPLPRDIEQCANWLLNEPMSAAFQRAPPSCLAPTAPFVFEAGKKYGDVH